MQKACSFIANVMELPPVCMKPPYCKLFSEDPTSNILILTFVSAQHIPAWPKSQPSLTPPLDSPEAHFLPPEPPDFRPFFKVYTPQSPLVATRKLEYSPAQRRKRRLLLADITTHESIVWRKLKYFTQRRSSYFLYPAFLFVSCVVKNYLIGFGNYLQIMIVILYCFIWSSMIRL